MDARYGMRTCTTGDRASKWRVAAVKVEWGHPYGVGGRAGEGTLAPRPISARSLCEAAARKHALRASRLSLIAADSRLKVREVM